MSTQAPIKLLLADVDGTLVTREKVLTPEAIEAVRALHDAGVHFAITSGRPPRGMQMLVDPLSLRTPIAGFNGGTFANPDLSVIEARNLSPEAARAALDAILASGLDAWLYTADKWLVRDVHAPHVDREAWTVKYGPEVVGSFTDDHLANAVKIVGVSDDADLVAKCEDDAREKLAGQASATRSQPYYLDVTNPRANKGAVADYLSEKLGIPQENIATIGDMPNDLLMFRRSGLSIAMGNASDQVKSKATEVTATNEENGFAKAVHRFILPVAKETGGG
jgi:Cof subfamily protein (haloacid dehalogenase superfamily)